MKKQSLSIVLAVVLSLNFILPVPVNATWIWDRVSADNPIEAYAPALAAALAAMQPPEPPINQHHWNIQGSDNPIEVFAPALAAALAAMAEQSVSVLPGPGPAPAPVTSDIAISPDNFRGFLTNHRLLDRDVLVKATHSGALLASRFNRELVMSVDQGLSWAFLYRFERSIEAIYSDNSGNIFVAVSNDRWAPVGTGELHKSTNGGRSFAKVLDIESGVPLNWNIASRNGTMFVSEYGYKGNSGNNARRIYRSLDFGNAWAIVYEPAPRAEWHNHKTLITSRGVVYQSIGDGENAQIIRSTDNGGSWSVAVEGLHPTSAVEFENHILWGLDAGSRPGIVRYDKNSGEITQPLLLPPPFNGPAYGMTASGGIVYAVFLSYEGYEHPASIFYSRDEGVSWNLFGYIVKTDPSDGIGLFNLTADGRFGYINIQTPLYRDGVKEVFRGTLRFDLLR